MSDAYWYVLLLLEEFDSSLLWVVIGAFVAFVIAFLLAKYIHHRIVPAVLLGASIVAFLVARWASGQPGEAMLQAQSYIIGRGLLGAAFGAIGWLVFARPRWAMTTSAVATIAFLLSLPFSAPVIACIGAGMCF